MRTQAMAGFMEDERARRDEYEAYSGVFEAAEHVPLAGMFAGDATASRPKPVRALVMGRPGMGPQYCWGRRAHHEP